MVQILQSPLGFGLQPGCLDVRSSPIKHTRIGDLPGQIPRVIATERASDDGETALHFVARGRWFGFGSGITEKHKAPADERMFFAMLAFPKFKRALVRSY